LNAIRLEFRLGSCQSQESRELTSSLKKEFELDITFTAHNIRLDNGTFTKPEVGISMEADPWCAAALRILDTVFPGQKSELRLADLGCLEGGYAVEFARMGFQVLGVEVRKENFAACQYVKANTDLPRLDLVCDNAWNINQYGSFDAVFCCGLLYHLDRPKKFLEILSSVTKKLLIVQTHFSTDQVSRKFPLSDVTENEGLRGRWYTEFATDDAYQNREKSKWSSWDNRRSFWIRRDHLLQTIQDIGFDVVLEQFDGLGANIVESMNSGYYHTDDRGTFIGIKASAHEGPRSAAHVPTLRAK
jgi:2-polyprenyl-3-methyl-5-hydroxy-6-metoxy-1,4-benzoquinol methylase